MRSWLKPYWRPHLVLNSKAYSALWMGRGLSALSAYREQDVRMDDNLAELTKAFAEAEGMAFSDGLTERFARINGLLMLEAAGHAAVELDQADNFDERHQMRRIEGMKDDQPFRMQAIRLHLARRNSARARKVLWWSAMSLRR